MALQVNYFSKVKLFNIAELTFYYVEVNVIKPEGKWSNREQGMNAWTCLCCKRVGWFTIWGERPIKLSNSWFSAKYVYA